VRVGQVAALGRFWHPQIMPDFSLPQSCIKPYENRSRSLINAPFLPTLKPEEPVFTYTDHFIKKEDDYIAFFADKLEPAIDAFQRRRFGAMMAALGEAAGTFSTHADKLRWSTCMEELAALRLTGNVGDVIDHICQIGYPKLPDAVIKREHDASTPRDPGETELPETISRTRNLRGIPYTEVIALDAFVDGHTPFATKHSVKGDEFENVLVVVGRGWNKYNFEQYFEWASSGVVPIEKQDAFERNRNLFYVACSRPTTRLALLFTQQLSASALGTLSGWFGAGNVRSFSP
jgi:DNA helicase II / ATP-dependent DNA helicase PcrA